MTGTTRTATETVTVSTPSGAVALDVAGEGATLLCLHGIGSSAVAFASLLDAPPRGWRVAAWDAPGYRRSDDPNAAPGMAGYAAAARSVVDALGDRHAVVVGVSWGGVIATRLALDAPSRVSGLVLVGSTVGSGVDPARAEAMRGRAADLAALGPDRFATQRAHRLLSRHASPDRRAAVVESMSQAVRLPGYRWAAEAMAATDHTARLGEIRVPTLVAAGTEDDVTGPAASAPLAAGIPGATLRLVRDAGHLANQERPAAFAVLLRDFLSALPNATGGPP